MTEYKVFELLILNTTHIQMIIRRMRFFLFSFLSKENKTTFKLCALCVSAVRQKSFLPQIARNHNLTA